MKQRFGKLEPGSRKSWVCFSGLFQRRRSTAETFLFMLSLHLALATLLPHLELIIPWPPQWPLLSSCILMSPAMAVRDLWLELASSVPFVQTTIFAQHARLEEHTRSMLCCPFGTRCRWGASWEIVCFVVCRPFGEYIFFFSVAVVSSGKMDKMDETLYGEPAPGSECESEPRSGSQPASSSSSCCWVQRPLWFVSGTVATETLVVVYTLSII